MKIETVYDKGSGSINEDALLVEAPLFGVFDGATSSEPYTNGYGTTGAAIASNLTRDVFSKSTGSLFETAHDANTALKSEMREVGINTSRKTALWATTAAVVKICENTFEWLQIGDSIIITLFKNGSFRLSTDEQDHDLETKILWKELANKRTENIREVLDNQFLKVRNRMNIDWGALNGEKEMEKFLHFGTVALEDVTHIILLTDGLFLPKEDPLEPEDFNAFVDLFLSSGLEKVKNHVREKELSDPKCWRYPRFKQHDDIGAISITF